MTTRDLDSLAAPSVPWTYPNLVLRTPPNWTAVGFLSLLAALHLSVGGRAFAAGRWEGYVSVGFGVLFTVAAVVTFSIRREVAVLYHRGVLRTRTGVGRWSAVRVVPFCRVMAVRVMLGPCGSARDSRVELICDHDDVPCPPSAIPRQLGLLLAMMIGAPLVKVSAASPAARESSDAVTPPAAGRPAQPQRRDESAAG